MADTTVRRNGQLSSCEPCRKAKVRCDHGRPICGRCIRRGNQCYYHPAPMSQRKSLSSPPPPYKPVITPASSHTSAVTSPASTTITTATSPPSEHLDQATGLVGMHSSLLAVATADDAFSDRAYAAITRTGVQAPAHPVAIAPSLINEGASMLGLLVDSLEEVEPMMDRYFGAFGQWIVGGPVIRKVLPGVVKSLKKLRTDQSQARLRELSRAIFERTTHRFIWPASPIGDALVEAFCAAGVPRWEVVGIYAATLSLFLATDSSVNSDADSFQYEKSLRSSLARKAFDVALQCETFSHIQGQVSDLTLWLMTKTTMTSTWCFGDDSYCTWRCMSTLSAMVIALDFHRPAQDMSHVPYYVLELRKQAISLINEVDKGMATFVNRPPFLNRLYYSYEMPADIPDEALMGSLEAFEAARSNVDSNGWNLDGKILPTARGRFMLMICPHREEALELAFGNVAGDPEYKANQILSGLESTWQSLPPHLRYDTAPRDSLPDSSNSFLAFSRLEYLYTRFLVYKRIVSINEKYRHQLIQTSHEIVSLVLSMLKRRSALVFHRNDTEWATALYAMPCAGVLFLELFRQIRQPQSQAVLSRSTIIKDISSLIICCDWLTETGQGNYQIIRQAQSIFSRGLDHVLDNPNLFDDSSKSLAADMTASHPHPQGQAPAELTDADFAMLLPQDLEWSTWLESFGLQTDPWFDLGAQQAQADFAMEGVS